MIGPFTALQWVVIAFGGYCAARMITAYLAMKALRVPDIPWTKRLWRGWWRKLEFYTDQDAAAEFLAAYDKWLILLIVDAVLGWMTT